MRAAGHCAELREAEQAYRQALALTSNPFEPRYLQDGAMSGAAEE
jgi:predicted RNA polymerase sigma factor